MRIAQVVPLHVAVPPKAYGGTERVVYNLTEALVRLGHDVTLFASGDSHTSARLWPGVKEAINFDRDVEAGAYHVAMLTDVYRQADQFDVIHSHLDYLTLPFIRTATTPTVITLHWRVDGPDLRASLEQYTDANYVSISKSQQRDHPDLNWVATVYHGVDVDNFTFYPEPDPEPYLAFVGRISPEKCPDRAIEVAKMSGLPLKIAAKVDPKDEEYFHTKIEPLLRHPLIDFVGELSELQKRELLGKARALLLPIDWPEPFGMVFIESLACGTPVLTRPCGSVPELLRDGVTGFIRSTTEELAEAVTHLDEISRRGCRQYVKRRFDTRRMALNYVNVYSRMLGGRPLFTPPVSLPPDVPDDQIERVVLS